MTGRRRRTPAEVRAAREQQDKLIKQAFEDAALLRWNVFVDTMIALAAELVRERPDSLGEAPNSPGNTEVQLPYSPATAGLQKK
jgi:hypothetical protein